MDTQQWIATGGIAVTLLIAAASWITALRRTPREALIQDLDIRDRLGPGVARDRREDSIDERVARMARRAERRRDDDLLVLAWALAIVGVCSLFVGALAGGVWVTSAGAVIMGTAAVAFGIGFPKLVPEGTKRLTPRRQPAPADAAEPPQTPEPAAQPSDPDQPESP